MTTLPAFRLHRPSSLEEALSILAERRESCRVIAGGTDLVVNLRDRLETPREVISLAAVEGLRGTLRDQREGWRIGALTTIGELTAEDDLVELFPVLARSAESVSGPTLRSMGTIGGNLCLDTRCHWFNQSYEWRAGCGFCLKKDGDVCHVARSSPICVATSCGDLAPALLALDARVTLHSIRGARELPLDEFYLDDGTRKYVLEPDEILTGVSLPVTSARRRGYFGKLRARGAIDYPLASVAVSGNVDDTGRLVDVTIALTAVGPRPFRVRSAERLLNGRTANVEIINKAAELVYRETRPLKTGGSYSPAYRRLRARLFVRDGLRAIAGLAPNPNFSGVEPL